MQHFKKALFAILAIPVFTGCASIVSKSNWPFSVDTNPSGGNGCNYQ